MYPLLRVTHLTKQFPLSKPSQGESSFTALKGISFIVEAGEVVGILGPNGAGKTTTIQMLLSASLLQEEQSNTLEKTSLNTVKRFSKRSHLQAVMYDCRDNSKSRKSRYLCPTLWGTFP